MSVTALAFKTTESHAEKIRRLRDEAEMSARDHSRAFLRAIADLESVAEDIADGGEVYPVGVRERARRLLTELDGARLNITSILDR